MTSFTLTLNQDALSSSPQPLLSSLSATTALPPLPLLLSLLLHPPSTRPLPLPPPRLRALSLLLLPTLLPTAPPRSLLPLLLAPVRLNHPPPEPLPSRALPLPSPQLVPVSSPSSVSSLLCKRLKPEVRRPQRLNFTIQHGIDMPDYQTSDSRLVSLTLLFLFPHQLCDEQGEHVSCIPWLAAAFSLPFLLRHLQVYN
jgi:hypothetical protein